MNKPLFVYITFENRQAAESAAKQLVEQRLAACANIFPAHQSIYRWEEKIETAQEVAAIFKTTDDRFEALEALVKEKHSYDCPCIVALPIEKGHIPFLKWIEQETSQDKV